MAVIGASPGGFGTILAQNAWLPVLRTLGTRPWFGGRLMVSQAGQVFNEAGEMIDEKMKAQLQQFLQGFVAEALRSAGQLSQTGESDFRSVKGSDVAYQALCGAVAPPRYPRSRLDVVSCIEARTEFFAVCNGSPRHGSDAHRWCRRRTGLRVYVGLIEAGEAPERARRWTRLTFSSARVTCASVMIRRFVRRAASPSRKAR